MHVVAELDVIDSALSVVDCSTGVSCNTCVLWDKVAVSWRQSRIEFGMVDEEVRAYSATIAGLPNKTSQVVAILLRERIHRPLDAVIQVDYRETVLAFWGFTPSVSQLFGATSWAHSNPQQADWGRFHERSLALKSVDDSWKLESRVAHNYEGPRSSGRHRRERETDVRTEGGHECVGFFQIWLYARLQQQDL